MKIGKIVAFMAVSVSTLAFSFVGVASAHVVVQPSDVQTGSYQIFSVGAPAERDSPTVRIKLTVPQDLTSVTPTVKPGWTIQIDKKGEGQTAVVTAITWTGGEIGSGYRDEFTFSAKTPDHPMDLQWKIYQTYKDGTVVSWDQSGGGDTDVEGATTGPFSVTKVASATAQDIALKNVDSKADSAQQAASRALYVGIGGIVLAAIAIVVLVVMCKQKV